MPLPKQFGYDIIAEFDGVGIHKIIYGIDDYVVIPQQVWSRENNAGEKTPYVKLQKYRIRYTISGAPFFIYGVRKIFLDECIRTNLGEKS